MNTGSKIDRDFRARINELCERSQRANIEVFTHFLDAASQVEAQAICKFLKASYSLHGGYLESERKILFILPDYIEEPTLDRAMCALGVSCSGNLTHRDYLGALLSLGIKRECIGDILVDESGAKLVCTSGVADFLLTSLTRVGRQNASIDRMDFSELKSVDRPMKRTTCTVASMRLDALAGNAFSVSRSKMAEYIESGFVSVNWSVELDKSREIFEGDTISVRKMGRARIAEIGGMSKKERIFVSIETYI